MRLALAAGLCLPLMAHANALTFEVWPDGDPDRTVSCSVRLARGMITAVEVQGPGMPPALPMRWPVRQDELSALLTALQAFVSQDLVSVDPTGTRLPAPPFVSVTWMARVSGGMETGLYVQTGLVLPPVLQQVIDRLLPNGPCDLALG